MGWMLPLLWPRSTRPPEKGAGEVPVWESPPPGRRARTRAGVLYRSKGSVHTPLGCGLQCGPAARMSPLQIRPPRGRREGACLPCTCAAGRLMILRGWGALWELKRPSSCTGEQRGDQPVHGDNGDSGGDYDDGSSFTRCQASPSLCVCDTPGSRPPKSPHFMYEDIEAQGGGWPMLG